MNLRVIYSSLFKKNNSATKFYVSLLISFLSIYFLVSFAGVENILGKLSSLSLVEYAYVAVILFLTYPITSLRLNSSLGLNPRKHWFDSLNLSIVHSFLLTILPVRLGDAIYPSLIKKYFSKNWPTSISNLILIRLYDLASAFIIFIVFFALIELDVDIGNHLLIYIIATILLLAASFFIIYLLLKSDSKYRLPNSWREFILSTLSSLNGLSVKMHILVALLTLLRWSFIIVFYLAIFNFISIDISFKIAAFIVSGMALSAVLPLHSIGGIGVVDSVLAMMLILIGINTEDAVTSAIIVRFVWIIVIFSIFLFWIIIRMLLGSFRQYHSK